MLRNWDLNIQISRDSSVAIHKQIEIAIIAHIKKGLLKAGAALPGTRALATLNNINRKTVIQAYENLTAKGWLVTEVKRGTFVADQKTRTPLTTEHPPEFIDPELQYPPRQLTNFKHFGDEVIEFGPGLPDSRLMPFNMISRALRKALITISRSHYNENKNALGSPDLREAIFKMLHTERSINGTLNQLCTLPNPTICMHVVAKTLIKPGQKVMLETYCPPSIVNIFKNAGAQIIAIAHDEHGIDVNHIENIFLNNTDESTDICAVYVSPNHQVPTSVCMSIERRKKLLTLAQKHDFVIIENDDDYYFNNQKVPYLPIASAIDAQQQVVYIGSLDKAVSNSLSIGYIVSDEKLVKQFANKHALISQQNMDISEIALAQLLSSGQIKKHINRNNKIYAARQAHVLHLIKKELNEFATVTSPNYGLSFWLQLNANIDLKKLTNDLNQLKVSITSSAAYTADSDKPEGLILGFGNLNEIEATEGILRIKHAMLKQTLN